MVKKEISYRIWVSLGNLPSSTVNVLWSWKRQSLGNNTVGLSLRKTSISSVWCIVSCITPGLIGMAVAKPKKELVQCLSLTLCNGKPSPILAQNWRLGTPGSERRSLRRQCAISQPFISKGKRKTIVNYRPSKFAKTFYHRTQGLSQSWKGRLQPHSQQWVPLYRQYVIYWFSRIGCFKHLSSEENPPYLKACALGFLYQSNVL